MLDFDRNEAYSNFDNGLELWRLRWRAPTPNSPFASGLSTFKNSSLWHNGNGVMLGGGETNALLMDGLKILNKEDRPPEFRVFFEPLVYLDLTY